MKAKVSFIATIALLTHVLHSAAQGTAFTYQGRLNNSGAPFTGSAEFQPTLWDAATNGTSIANNSPLTMIVSVTNGLFVLPLDFGGAFPGADRWLQLDVRTTLGPFTTLAPRQKLTATPYAVTAGNLTGTLSAGQLAGIYSNAVTLSNVANVLGGNGANLISLNASQLTSGTVPIAALGNAWKINGNNGTSPTNGNFIGTTDDQPVEVKVNGQRVMRFERQTNFPFGFFTANVIGGYESNTVPVGIAGATIAGGGGPQWYGTTVPNTVNGQFGTIGGGVGNVVQSPVSTIAGGERGNIGIFGYNSFLGGGAWNTVDSPDSMIGGGRYNLIQSNGYASTIVGGYNNIVRSNLSYAAIGGGYGNIIQSNASYAAIAGGYGNTANASYSTVGGGFLDNAAGSYSTVPGGYANSANGAYSFAAGTFSQANHNGSFVWADNSTLTGFASTAANQFNVRATGGVRFVTGGSGVSVDGATTVTTANLSNQAWTVTGNRGLSPTNGNFLGTLDNQPLELKVGQLRALRLEPDTNYSSPNVIGGSRVNFVDPGVVGAFIGGGGTTGTNFALGGGSNRVAAIFGTIAGGRIQTVAADHGFIGGGYSNTIQSFAYDSVIGGGVGNQVLTGGGAGTIAGGVGNIISGGNAAVGGGYANTASGYGATIPGGSANLASGQYSFAAGYSAQAAHNGAFVWADNSGAGAYSSTAVNQFLIRAAGGVGINTPSPAAALHVVGATRFDGDISLGNDYRRIEMTGGNSLGFVFGSYPYFLDGVHLGYNFYADAAGSPHVINAGGGSSRITASFGEVVLAVGNPGFGPNVVRLRANSSGVTVYGTFNNSSDRNVKKDFAPIQPAEILEKVTRLPLSEWSYKEDPTTRHVGPMGQDFYSTFHIGTDEKHIAPLDEAGVALAAIQGLNEVVKKKDAKIASLEKRLNELEALVHTLAERK